MRAEIRVTAAEEPELPAVSSITNAVARAQRTRSSVAAVRSRSASLNSRRGGGRRRSIVSRAERRPRSRCDERCSVLDTFEFERRGNGDLHGVPAHRDEVVL